MGFLALWKWLGTVMVALNQLGNAVLGGSPDMAISARTGLAREHGSRMAAGWCHVLDWVDPRDGDGPRGDHCAMSVDVYRARTRVRAQGAGVFFDLPPMDFGGTHD
jgi:hypothetical protein